MPTARRLLARAALATVPLAVVAGAVLAAQAPASADYAGPDQPIGSVEQVTAPDSHTVEFTGWTADPDALTSNVLVSGVVDGYPKASAWTSIPRPRRTATYHLGPTPGFVLDVPVPSGNHTVCLVARNIGAGLNRVMKCSYTPLGRTPSSAEVATHSPRGAITWTSAWSTGLHVFGWASDPDYLARRLDVELYVDGTWTQEALTAAIPGRTLPDGAGMNPWFNIIVPVSSGAHLACVWVVDIAQGDNSSLGCQAADTRGTGSGTVTPPPVNASVVTEAKKHIGQDYVWGAAGPTTFDCSGLVTYSYAKFGVSSPHQSEQQFRLAHVITAARAVPGDLVFYHDSSGDVYHVGIYLSPGQTVAAIDEAEGVDYQTIWDPSTATYGSLTHT